MHSQEEGSRLTWDVFCRVIDNYGDIGVCWRLAADLASRDGVAVRLWIDDASALRWMAPRGAPGVSVQAWPEADAAEPGDVVIEAFGCDLPERFVQRMAARRVAPVWVNLEYLSAEAYVERSHRLPSPQSNGLKKWFFYPGFTRATGGLLREPGLLQAQMDFDRAAWLSQQGIARRPGERLISLFSYPNPALSALLARASAEPTLLLLTAGMPEPAALPAGMRSHRLPWLDQAGYDRLLWACDLNLVRGEDSFVRAQWAGRPFIWHIYPQDDSAHAAKLCAFLDLFPQVPGLPALWLAWNGLGTTPSIPPLPVRDDWEAASRAWREELVRQEDLTTQLLGFVAGLTP